MWLPMCLVLLLHPLSAWGSYGQTSRCLTVQDGASRILVAGFLNNASSCSTWVEGRNVMKCAEDKMPSEAMTMLLPLIKTVKRWEADFRTDLNTAFSSFGQDTCLENGSEDGLDFHHYIANVWTMLLRHWASEGQLCYYDNSPSYADHLDPRAAGLLTLFFSDPEGLRPPILKPRAPWTYADALGCSASGSLERSAQIRAVSKMAQRARATARGGEKVMEYHEIFSTDPFLQAVITGLKLGLFYCPRDLYCYGSFGGVERGIIHLPLNNQGYLDVLARKLEQGVKVCIIFRNVVISPDVFYVTPGVSTY